MMMYFPEKKVTGKINRSYTEDYTYLVFLTEPFRSSSRGGDGNLSHGCCWSGSLDCLHIWIHASPVPHRDAETPPGY